jgi:gliding motility-associated protein GldM
MKNINLTKVKNKLTGTFFGFGIIAMSICLNSCSSEVSENILDSFVFMDENTQKSAITQLDRGNIYLSDLKASILQNKKENPVLASKGQYYLNKVSTIDSETAEIIKFIDEIKIEIIKKSGEDVNNEKNLDKSTIIWKKYSNEDKLRPARLNLMAIKKKSEHNVPMGEIVGEEINNPSADKMGMKLWKMYNDYRTSIIETIGTYHDKIDSVSGEGLGTPKWVVKSSPINIFKDNKDLEDQVNSMLDKTQCNNEDRGVLKHLYIELTKQERFEEVNKVKNVHWIGKTFDQSPLVGALSSLTTMQHEILSARATAVGLLSSKVQSSSQFSFNKLIALASASRSVVNPGDPIEISVVMGAYDSDNQPMVTGGNFTVSNGMGVMKTTAGTSDMKYSGTIAIKSRAGAIKELPWETNVVVLTNEKEASIETPEMQVFYEGIPIELKASATGMYKNVRMSVPSPYTAPIGSAGSYVTVSLTGTDTDGNSVSLGSKRFIVKKAPKPELFWNGVEAGGQANISAGNLECRFGNDVPFSPAKGKFTIINYVISIEGSELILKGSGNSISSSHLNALKNSPSKKITITVDYTGTGEGTVSSVFKN